MRKNYLKYKKWLIFRAKKGLMKPVVEKPRIKEQTVPESKQTLDIQKNQLSLERAGRQVNPIRFIVEPDTFIGKRIRAIIDVAGIEINFDLSSASTLSGVINDASIVYYDNLIKGIYMLKFSLSIWKRIQTN
jgi:hypothetical protein